jgi:excisionase family DNA binding protein
VTGKTTWHHNVIDIRTALRLLADALPAGTALPVPRELLIELLDGSPEPDSAASAPADLTVEAVAERFGRHPSTVRGWISQQLLPGAYRLRGREWRVPAAALRAFEATARRGMPVASVARTRQVDISDWRRVAR